MCLELPLTFYFYLLWEKSSKNKKNPSLTQVRKKRSTKTRFLGLGIKLPIEKVPHMRKHPSRTGTRSLLVNCVCGSIWVKDQITSKAKHTTWITPTLFVSSMLKNTQPKEQMARTYGPWPCATSKVSQQT